MYLIGAPHPHKADSQRLLEQYLAQRERLLTDAEVLQEILRRYAALDRRDAIQPAFEALLGIVDEVLPIDESTVRRAKDIVLGNRRISPRDAIHLAAMEKRGIHRIMSFDAGFDSFPGIERLGK
jgi:predicted nucleic acid-binding protein